MIFTGLITRARGLTSRFGWGMADQVVSSGTNFLLSVLVARSVSAEEFGQFALVFWTYVLLMNLGRAVGTQPLWVSASHVERSVWRRAMAGSAGAVLVVGLGLGALLVGTGLVIGGQALAFVALGVGLPGLLLQDAYRLGLIADARAQISFVSDLIWAVVMALLLLSLTLFDVTSSVPVFVATWAAGALAGSVYAIWACSVLPAPATARSWLTTNLALIRGFTVYGLSDPVAQTSIQYILAAVAGLVTVAAIRAGQLLLSPLTVAFQGIYWVLTPEASRTLRSHPSTLVRQMARVAGLVVIITLIYGFGIMLLPAAIGEELLGDSWVYARPVVPVLVLAVAAHYAASAAATGLLVMGAASSMAKIGLFTAPVSVTLAVAGAAWGGTMGAAAGVTAGYVVIFAVEWIVFLRRSRAASRSVEANQGAVGSMRAGSEANGLSASSPEAIEPDTVGGAGRR